MARTYFKAQPTAAETQIDWAEVGKNFSDMLTEEARVREEKKAAIDEASRQYQKTLNDVEQGQSATANQWWLTASNEMQEQMLMQDRMLKSGALNPRDYTLMRQNLVDGTDGLIEVFGKFNEEFKDRMDRFENGESQDLEQWAMAELENFGNFQKTAVVVNPETGMLSVADVDENGAIVNDPNKIRSVTSMQNLIARRYDKYDLDGATTEFADSIGTWDEINRKYGGRTAKGLIEKVSDPFVKEFSKEELMSLGMSEADAIKYSAELNVYRAGEDRFVEDIMSVWSNTSSILTNSMSFAPNGEEYTFTFNEERAENEILLRKDGQGQIFAEYTEEQEAAVAEAIRDSLRNKLDRTIDTTVVSDFTPKTSDERKSGEALKQQGNAFTNVTKLYSGTDAEVEEAEAFLRSINPDITSITRNNNGVVVTYKDGSTESLDFQDQNQRAWSTGATNFFLPTGSTITDIEETIKASGFSGIGAEAPSKFERDFVNAEITTTETKEDLDATITRELGANLDAAATPQIFVDNQSNTARDVRAFLATVPGVDFTVNAEGVLSDIISISVDGEEVKRYDLDGINETQQQEYFNDLKDFVIQYYITNTGLEDKATQFGTKRQTTQTQTRAGQTGNSGGTPRD